MTTASNYITNLTVIHYPPDHWGWESIKTPSPNWLDIEKAIRQLDRKEWPIVHLDTCEHVPGTEPEDQLTITGGRGEYWITFMPKAAPEVHYADDSRGDEIIPVWESDQGAHVIERHLCNDLFIVLAVAKHFYENGVLYPDVRWEAY